MAPKLSKTKGDAKDKIKAISSSTIVETPLSLVSIRCNGEFEENHKDRLVVKQYVWKASVVVGLDLHVVADLVAHQQIDYFLQLAQDYNEDLIRVFYFGLHAREGSCFKFTIGNVVYEFTDELWKSLFGITVVDANDDDEVDSLVMNIDTHIHFKWKVHVS